MPKWEDEPQMVSCAPSELTVWELNFWGSKQIMQHKYGILFEPKINPGWPKQ